MEVEMAALGIGRGVDEPRREEIRVFLTERFERSRDTQEKVGAACGYGIVLRARSESPEPPLPPPAVGNDSTSLGCCLLTKRKTWNKISQSR